MSEKATIMLSEAIPNTVGFFVLENITKEDWQTLVHKVSSPDDLSIRLFEVFGNHYSEFSRNLNRNPGFLRSLEYSNSETPHRILEFTDLKIGDERMDKPFESFRQFFQKNSNWTIDRMGLPKNHTYVKEFIFNQLIDFLTSSKLVKAIEELQIENISKSELWLYVAKVSTLFSLKIFEEHSSREI